MTGRSGADLLTSDISELGGAEGDLKASGGEGRERSERLERAVRNAEVEDMSRNDSPGRASSDSLAFASVTGWHPFMRFLYRVADMEYAFVDDRRERVHMFVDERRRTFWVCFWADFTIVFIGAMGVVALAIYAGLKTLGLV